MKKNFIKYLCCLKQQSFLLVLCLIVGITSYSISLHFGFREPYHVTLQDFIKFSLGFIFVGAFVRLLTQKDCCNDQLKFF